MVRVEDLLKDEGSKSAYGVIAVKLNATASEALMVMRERGVHHLLVGQNGKIEGLISDQLLYKNAYDPYLDQWNGAIAVSHVMIKEYGRIDSEATLPDLLEEFRRTGIRAAVVCKNEVPCGIVTITDVLSCLERAPSIRFSESDDSLSISKIFLSDPLMQSAMKMLSDIGV